MANKIPVKTRRYIENAAIFMMILLALFIFVVTFIPASQAQDYLYRFLGTTRTLQRFFAVVFLASAWRLYKRSHLAWIISIVMIACSIGIHSFAQHSFFMIPIIIETLSFIVFWLFYRDFSRPMDRSTAVHGMYILPVMVVLMLLNRFIGPAIELNWLLLYIGLLLIFAPFMHQPKATLSDKEHVLKLCRTYGYNPCAWLALEDDKTYFFGTQVDGVAAYAVSETTMVICGDPICADEDFPVFLKELSDYCALNNYDMVFLAITDRYLEHYKKMGFGYVKCGEEPRFKLSDYDLKGGKAAKVRADVNHARKAGLTVCEYKPLDKRDPEIEQAIDDITKEWLGTKDCNELIFTLGGVGLEDPNDKRYFYAKDDDGVIQGFMVFLPFLNGTAYYADVTRRRTDAPRGVMEVILYDAFQIMKDTGVEWGSMGLAPLAHLDNPENDKGNELIAAILTFVHDHMNSIYGFDSLTRAKEKYNPTVWLPAYFAYMPKILSPQMALAAVAVQSPNGLTDYITAFFNNLKKDEKKGMDEKNNEQKKEDKKPEADAKTNS